MRFSELLDVVFRWGHLIAGIMWVGNSMLFNWLDRNLEKHHPGLSRLSQGKIFMLHSGAFYDVEKKLLEPGEMPATLHWFKWQNFATWATGISLFVIVYYMGKTPLVDPAVKDYSNSVAIAMSVGILFCAWLLYDTLWDTVGQKNPRLATMLSIAGLFASIFAFTRFFSGPAAYMQTGVMIGTLMTGNVWMVIVPSQKQLVAATLSGKEQDASLSIRAKQRSIHNNYLTFPLLFIMLSNHFGAATSHSLNWLILILVMIGGAGVRHFMNVRYRGGGIQLPKAAWLAPAFGAGAFAIAGLMIVTRLDTKKVVDPDAPVTFSRVQEIVATRCVMCHSRKPSDPVFTSPPKNVMFDNPRTIQLMASQIRARVVEQQNMPFNNQSGMTMKERGEIKRWIDDGAKLDAPAKK